MRPEDLPAFFWFFMAAYLVLAGATWWFLSRSRDASLKRKVLHWGTFTASITFVAAIWVATRKPWFLFLATAMVALISFFKVRRTKFCVSCGATLYHSNWLVSLEHCYRCGALLNDPG